MASKIRTCHPVPWGQHPPCVFCPIFVKSFEPYPHGNRSKSGYQRDLKIDFGGSIILTHTQRTHLQNSQFLQNFDTSLTGRSSIKDRYIHTSFFLKPYERIKNRNNELRKPLSPSLVGLCFCDETSNGTQPPQPLTHPSTYLKVAPNSVQVHLGHRPAEKENWPTNKMNYEVGGFKQKLAFLRGKWLNLTTMK